MFNVKRWTEEDKDQQGIGFSELICWKSKAVTWCMWVLTGVYSRVENSWRWTVGCELVKSKCSVGGCPMLSGVCGRVQMNWVDFFGIKIKCPVGVSSVDRCIQIIQQGGEQLEMDCCMWKASTLWVYPVLTGVFSRVGSSWRWTVMCEEQVLCGCVQCWQVYTAVHIYSVCSWRCSEWAVNVKSKSSMGVYSKQYMVDFIEPFSSCFERKTLDLWSVLTGGQSKASRQCWVDLICICLFMFKNKNTRCVISVDRWTEEDKTAALDGFDCVCSCLKRKTLGV